MSSIKFHSKTLIKIGSVMCVKRMEWENRKLKAQQQNVSETVKRSCGVKCQRSPTTVSIHDFIRMGQTHIVMPLLKF